MNGKGWLQVTREWSTQPILLLYSWYYSRFYSLSQLFYARPRYQKQRSHENTLKTNPPNWRGTWQVRCKRAHALWQNSSHARSMSSQGRARYIAVRKLMLRALVLVSWMHLGRGSRVFLPNVFLGQTRRESRTENIGTSSGLHFILKDVLCR